MAGTSFFNKVRMVSGLPAIMLTALAMSACGQGDGPVSIPNEPVTPLPDVPAGFCDPINFEIVCPRPGIVNFGGGASIVLDNPDASGINESETVVRMQKFADQPFGGTRLDPVDVPIDFANGTFFKMKVWSEREVPVTFKLEETLVGVGGVEKVDTHTGGSTWQELCYSFATGVPAMPTLAFTIIFDNGVTGQAQAGVFEGDWTFYYDDITQTTSCGDGDDISVDPDAALYRTDGDPDLTIPDDYSEVTAFVSGAVINDMFADDATYMPAIAVSSGVGLGANVAQIGYIGFDAGFLNDYESIIFKAKDLPDNVIIVRLYDGVAQRQFNLTSSGFSQELDDGWYQVEVPLTEFSNIANATGIVLESNNTSAMPFTMLLTDVGFGADTGPPPIATLLGIYSETNNDPNAQNVSTETAGDEVVIDTGSTAVPAFEGAVSASFTFNPGGQGFGGGVFAFSAADASAFDSLRFAIDSSAMAGFADLTVQIEPPVGGTAGGNVALSSYAAVETSGNWNVYEIPLADFTAVDPTGIEKVSFFNARDGGGTLLGGTLYFDDIYFTDGSGGGTPPPPMESTLGVFSETNTNPAITLTGIASIGNPVTIDSASTAVTPFEGAISLGLIFSDNTAGNGFGGITIDFEDEDVSAYDALKFAIDTSAFAGLANLTVQLEPPGGGTPGGNVPLGNYTPVSTTGNWDVYEIPLTDFTAVNPSTVNKVGFFNARDGGDVLLAGTLYLDDIHFTTVSGGGGPAPGPGAAVNGDFETGDFTGWQQFLNSGVQTISMDTPANGGSFSAALSANTAPGLAGTTEIKQANIGSGTLNVGDVISVSYDVKGTFGPGGQLNVLAFTEFGGGGGDLSDQQVINIGVDNWTNFSYDVTLSGADASGGFSLAFNPVCGAVVDCVADVFIDNVSIVIN